MSKNKGVKQMVGAKSIPNPKGAEPKTPQQPEQPQMTEDQAFMAYINQLMSNIILEHENAKTSSIEAIKNIGQKLNLYMREVSRLTKENETLKKQVDELKKK